MSEHNYRNGLFKMFNPFVINVWTKLLIWYQSGKEKVYGKELCFIIQRNATLRNEDILWNKDTSVGLKLPFFKSNSYPEIRAPLKRGTSGLYQSYTYLSNRDIKIWTFFLLVPRIPYTSQKRTFFACPKGVLISKGFTV
jgi:hypothetical protein